MRYLLEPLKLFSGNINILPLGRHLGRRIAYFSKYIRKPEQYYSQVTLTSLYLNTVRRNHVGQPNTNISEIDSTEQDSITDADFTYITNNDPVLEKKLKILFLEVEVLRQSGFRVPEFVKLDQWHELLKRETRSSRRKYLAYLFGVEKKRVNKKLKKEERRELREALLVEKKSQDENNEHIKYRLGDNSIFLRIYDTTINNYFNWKLMQAMMFSQKIILDCGYDGHMTSRESQNCGKQVMLLFSDNRFHDQPFDLHLCNAHHNSATIKQLYKYIPTLYDSEFPLNIKEESYLDLFPKEKLVYLTPHCREELKTFDHDAVYIIGAMVDKVNNEPLSLAKAKREGLKMAKLPLDKYLLWGSGGSKSLTLNQVMRILLDIRHTGDWDKALVHVPKRKIFSEKPLEERTFRIKPRDRHKLF